jgi:hypothetical protein
MAIHIPAGAAARGAGADPVPGQASVQRRRLLRNQGLNRLSNAGLLVGLNDITEARGFDVKPYLLGATASAPGRGHSTSMDALDIGADLFYNPTPGVRTTLTINTDFAQTEVDQRLTNLERFPQFFPEKRDFFLDGATFFDFQSSAAGDNSLLPFFTRRIGLNQGIHQKIDAGGKLAGRPRQHRLIRTIQYGVSSNLLYSTADNRLLNRDFDLTLINLGTHRQDSFQVHVLPTFERLERSFRVSPRITLPLGESTAGIVTGSR